MKFFYTAFFCLCATIAQAQGSVTTSLLLAIDVSDSVDIDELKLQQQATAAAIEHPDFVQTVMEEGSIEVAVMTWAGEHQQSLLIPWHIISSQQSAQQLAEKIRSVSITSGSGTNIAAALEFGLVLFKETANQSSRWVIDISGDGKCHAAPETLQAVRKKVGDGGITVNGLAIYSPDNSSIDIKTYFEEKVIIGKKAFVWPVRDSRDYRAFSDALLIKLITEVGQYASLL